MLGQRVLTALVLLALLLPALFADSPWAFVALTLLMVGAGGWEWSRLNGQAGPVAIGVGLLVALAGAAAVALGWATAAPAALWWLAAAGWVVMAAVALPAGPQGWPSLPRAARLLLGVLLLWAAWLALAQSKTLGVNYLLSVLCLVWAADIAAYFGGRSFGRRKLAPAISPGKSWEGVWSGAAGVLVLAAVWWFVDRHAGVDSPSLYSRLWQRLGPLGALAALLLLAGMSVAGDLFESLVKRAAGAKDSSALLPGHGGVLDRIDALLPVVPIALALASL